MAEPRRERKVVSVLCCDLVGRGEALLGRAYSDSA
jgi:hypothetical protein